MNKAISELLSKSTSEGSLIGVNCLVFKDGKELYSGSFGFADRENKIPMSRDSIFRLFSLSKPVTSAAAMILIDRGILSPDDPVSKFFSEYADLRYSSGRDESDSEIILPCPDELKISHLLTMTSGLPYANNFCESVCASARLFDAVIRGNDGQGTEVTTEEFTRRAAEIPLMFRPGEHWDYGISADILGGVIEKASGVKYSRFLKENIFEPLGMNDTGFWVPPEKRNRDSLFPPRNSADSRLFINMRTISLSATMKITSDSRTIPLPRHSSQAVQDWFQLSQTMRNLQICSAIAENSAMFSL